MKTILAIFLGGGLGSVARYLLGSGIARIYPQPFPLGTLIVNIIACFLVGVLAGILSPEPRSEFGRAMLIIGFCGGFSTFSTFTTEALQLINSQMTTSAVLYTLLSLVLCLAATFAGLRLSGAW